MARELTDEERRIARELRSAYVRGERPSELLRRLQCEGVIGANLIVLTQAAFGIGLHHTACVSAWEAKDVSDERLDRYLVPKIDAALKAEELGIADAREYLGQQHGPEAIANLLQRAIMSGRLDLVRLVLEEYGFDPNVPTSDGIAALHVAVECYEPEIIEYLCTHGADPNARKPGGWTPLHLAVDIEADSGHQEERPPAVRLLEILLAAGADRGLPDDEGKTAKDLAIEWGHATAARLLG